MILNLDYQNSYKLTPKNVKPESKVVKDSVFNDRLPSIKSNKSRNLYGNAYNNHSSNDSLQLPNSVIAHANEVLFIDKIKIICIV